MLVSFPHDRKLHRKFLKMGIKCFAGPVYMCFLFKKKPVLCCPLNKPLAKLFQQCSRMAAHVKSPFKPVVK